MNLSRAAPWLLVVGSCLRLQATVLGEADFDSKSASLTTEGSTSLPASHIIEANTEVLAASDLTLTDHSVGYRQIRRKAEFNLAVSYSTISLDYAPASFDIISQPNNLSEGRLAFQTGLKRKVTTALTLFGGAGLYDGFGNYRTLWLSEYYRQYFSEVEGYGEPNPGGYNGSAGLRWEYLPASGFVQIEALFSRDDIPSGYEIVVRTPPQIGTDLVRSSDRLYTAGGRLIFENVLTRRLRTLNEFQIVDTTDREPRLSYQGSLNWAVAEAWVLRPALGFSREEPNFRAYSVGGTLERDWEQTWFVSVFGRYYKDNGEIDNPQLFNVAAPALETIQFGAGLRWQAQRWSAKIVAGPYFTRYASVEAEIKPFENLYRNRDWFMAQASVHFRF